MASHERHRTIVLYLGLGAVLAAGLSCDGGGAPPAQPPEETAFGRLTTGRTAADEQARATAYADRAARYRQLSDENKQAVAGLTRAIAGQAESATGTRAQVAVRPPAPAGAIEEATLAPADVRATRQAAADLADRLAAAAQKAADLHTRRAAEQAARASGRRVRR